MRHLEAVIAIELLHPIQAWIGGREHLAHPVWPDPDRRACGALGDALSPPADDVGAIDLGLRKLDLDLGVNPPAAGLPAPGATLKTSFQEGDERGLSVAVLARRPGFAHQLPVDDLVKAHLYREGEELSDSDARLLRG